MPNHTASLKKQGIPHRGTARLRNFLLPALLALVLLESALLVKSWMLQRSTDTRLLHLHPDAPHSQEVGQILKPLRYSGVPTLLRPDVRLSLDFNSRSWAFMNFYLFDSYGRILLEEDRYGVCGSLAAAAYQRVKPLLDPRRYDIKFVRISESNFFLPPRGTHFVLRIADRKQQGASGVYILDPAFRRYGPVADFDDYLFQEESELLHFMEARISHLGLEIDVSTPIRIRRDRILNFSVDDVHGEFDLQNYALRLTVRERHHFKGHRAFEIWKEGGQEKISENRTLALQMLEPEEYDRLRARIVELFRTVEQHEHDSPPPLSWRSKQIGYSGPDCPGCLQG